MGAILLCRCEIPLFVTYVLVITVHSAALRALQKSYLIQFEGRPLERPQHLFMRTAVAIHGSDIDRIVETYDLLSANHFLHSLQTFLDAGKTKQQLGHSYILSLGTGGLDRLYQTLSDCASIASNRGSIGLNIQKVPSFG